MCNLLTVLLIPTLTLLAAERDGLLVLPGTAPRYSGPQGRESDVTELVIARDQAGGVLGVFRQIIVPKSGPPTHVHQGEDEFFYVVSGEFRFKLGDRVMHAPAESLIFVPRGTAHTFQNIGNEPGVVLVGVMPGGFEQMFQERQGADLETNRALMKKHKMEVVGPPLQ